MSRVGDPPGLRDEASPEIDAALLRLVRGIVPVPDVLEVRRGVAAADQPGLLVTSFLLVFAMPSLTTASALLFLDRHLGTHFFHPLAIVWWAA